jgi:hypothetical protein
MKPILTERRLNSAEMVPVPPNGRVFQVSVKSRSSTSSNCELLLENNWLACPVLSGTVRQSAPKCQSS